MLCTMKNLILVLTFAAACALMGCRSAAAPLDVPYAAAAPSGGVPPFKPGERFVGISSSACLGTCAVYELYVFSDGRVLFIGKQHTGHEGRATKNIAPTVYQDLAVLLARTGVLDREIKAGTCLTDHPHLTIMRGPSKQIEGIRRQELDSGCDGQADLARDIETRFIEDTEIQRWLVPSK